MNSKISLGLVEDQLLFRNGLKAILKEWDDMEVIFESDNGYSVIDSLKKRSQLPQVMLIDLSLPNNGDKPYSGEHLTIEMLEQFPDIKILILSAHKDDKFITRLIEVGAHGYLLKDCDPQELYEAITTVNKVGAYINQYTLQAIQQNHNKRVQSPFTAATDLTGRELEILQLVCQQYTAEEIAEQLFISIKTVNGHRANLLAKTNSRNVAGLVTYALKHELVKL